MRKFGLLCFYNDLRVADNPTLMQAASGCEKLICVYIQPPNDLLEGYAIAPTILRRQQLYQSLDALDRSLGALGQHIQAIADGSSEGLVALLERFNPCAVYRSEQANWRMQTRWNTIVERYPKTVFCEMTSHTLFESPALPFTIEHLPSSFSKFRRQVESLPIPEAIAAPVTLPPPITTPDDWRQRFSSAEQELSTPIEGGEPAAFRHTKGYFASNAAQSYKETRNALDGWENSTKFSLWLACGAISAREVVRQLRLHEAQQGANESTYWIYFELLWREYFQWYAHRHGDSISAFQGIATSTPNTSFYPQRFRKWCLGNTPYPIVNACMKQLNDSGYMSNRGRQLVASCLVHELALDWRYGAAYMAQNLLDYDFASNWGNWQYLAGVGSDPRGHRRFNLQKQSQTYDPDGRFIALWKGAECEECLDHVDIVDWPISN
jgi:deoxyribodipyrimidine photo-lyase